MWLIAAGYVVACQVPIYLMRSSRFTALELAQTLRYLPDLVVVLTLLAAVGVVRAESPVALAGRVDASAAWRRWGWRSAFLSSSLYSTATFLTSWRDNPAAALSAERADRLGRTRRAASEAPLLDQEVDPLVLQRVAWPENLASHMFALLPDRPEFASATTQFRMLDGRAADRRAGDLGADYHAGTDSTVRLLRPTGCARQDASRRAVAAR